MIENKSSLTTNDLIQISVYNSKHHQSYVAIYLIDSNAFGFKL